MHPSDSAVVDGRAGITADLVRKLIADQFPQWDGLPIIPVEVDGWDNRTYRLGDDLSVRLPTAAGYVPAIAKEHSWLAHLAPALPVPIPTSHAVGAPAFGYPHPWSVRGWLAGTPARPNVIDDVDRFAVAVAEFLTALQSVDTTGGPVAGAHSFYRGAAPASYDEETRRCLADLSGRIDVPSATRVWDAALESEWDRPPVWFHGDVAVNNLLVKDGSLAAVIDFGTSGIGDPACDLVIAWTFFTGSARAAFREAVGLDDDTWARARGWALWKALLALAGGDENDIAVRISARVVDDVIAEHAAID
jgi:aminoglycoside phosphotransferase (APT) family kinase protein